MATFTFSERSFIGDYDVYNSLDESKRNFVGLLKFKPSLEVALREAGVPNHDIVLGNAKEFSSIARENPEIDALGLSDDEAGAISCYTLQCAEGTKSPYEIINQGIAGSRNRATLATTRKLIYLLLSGLRKLPRTRPSPGGIFYRGLKVNVATNQMEANGHQYYVKGGNVTWWAFTSTTTDLEATNNFISGAAASTLFNISGEDLWGYDIKAFSQFPEEEEILLEPEAKIRVNAVAKMGSTGKNLVVNVFLQKFDHLILEDIIPVGGSKTISTQRGSVSTQQNEGSGEISGGEKLVKPQAVQKKIVEKKWECAWKECPDNVDAKRKYSVDKVNPRIATFIGGDWCTIIGNTPLLLNKVTSWNIKILKSMGNSGGGIFIGVAPSDIDQNEWDNYRKRGWYFGCYSSRLYSGPPHNYSYPGKEYGPRKVDGQYVHTGDSVGVVMDTAKGELSFVVDGVNLGVAFEGIPLDKPLVPCVILGHEGDSVELDTSEVKENDVDNSIPVPSNTTTNNITWDSITLTWDAVEGASFYQIELNGSKFLSASTANTFTKRELLSETEYTFRVRAVRGNTVSEWSDVVKGRTRWRFPETSAWKECPNNVYKRNKYYVDMKNTRIASNITDYLCTIIGNTPLPLNKVTSWSIKVLKSCNNGNCIFIGVAPFDINQNESCNYNKCGWYFRCYSSQLRSGPPHNYNCKEYGPRKGDGEYVHTGDVVGVVMDTAKGELSFVVNGVNFGVAYEGIPLDKPLVPCVLLGYEGDSVELVI